MDQGVGHVVKRLREERDWSQAKLAVEADMSVSGVSMIENGQRNLTTTTLAKLAKAFGLEVRDLFPLGQAPLPLTEERGGRTSPGQKPNAQFDRWLEERGGSLHAERWEAFLERIDGTETEDLYELRRKFEEEDRALLEAAANHPDPHQTHRVIDRGTPRWMVIGLTLGRRALGQDVPAREVARGLVGAGHS